MVERRPARRAVVGEAELPVRVGLGANRVDRRCQPLRLRVVDGREHRDEGPVGELGRGQPAGPLSATRVIAAPAAPAANPFAR